MDNLLNSISQDVKQKIFECISQALLDGENEGRGRTVLPEFCALVSG